ncbi:aminopeptidase P family protein [Parvularcula dongshanensis]|uniref:Xaa-Pro aminopeptidase n=1 Tax=Parvularcula dongshanensis TaxID=1173995 RepID=A0A840I5K2_9PROT|nr:aminopeptidase P family protein [Parvularcula dongshanensis]MBB4660077.1 Xaa-Pro aminopeptidase [Parvularcula dongshanensis]
MFQTFDPRSDVGFAGRHLPLLRDRMKAQGLTGFVVPHDDAYLNEYLPDDAERLMWVSGFSGSAGAAVVMQDRAAIFTDGRYTLQVREQVDKNHFVYEDYDENAVANWLAKNAGPNDVIGYDPMLHAKSSLGMLEKAAKKAGFALRPTLANPIDEAWEDRPAPPAAAIVPQPEAMAGESAASKRERVGAAVAEAGADAALVTAPTSLAWLFNIRGGDVHASPLPLGRAILHADGTGTLFAAPGKVGDELRAHLGNEVATQDEASVEEALRALSGKRVMVDPGLSPVRYLTVLEEAGATPVLAPDPVALPRAVKNEGELQGAREAHLRDGAAITRFLHWLAHAAPSGNVTEIEAAKRLEAFRADTGELRDISFDTISAAGPHGASPHYRVTTETDRRLDPGSLFLIDSGGQYQDGTTDITRVVSVGRPTEEMRRRYTLVLKGHIALSVARFPRGTSGHALDAFARKPLWDAGLDFDHGTGHGVGVYLGVHEGPQKISKHPIAQALLPGMICSNEPGYYKAGEYGIRIENLIIVTPPAPIEGGDREMMGFETITFAPYERELIVPEMLTAEERAWVDAYHAEVFEKIGPRLPEDVASWLRARTAPL